MNPRGYLFALLPVLLLVVIACTGQTNAEPAPPTIHYGEDMCEFCGMIISEERYAAGYLTKDGAEYIFDDIGDMVQAHLERQDQVIAFFVHDYEGKTWVRAEPALYVLSQNLTTPMASGLAAFTASEKAAALAAGTGGQVMSFDELLSYYEEGQPMAAGAEHHRHDR